jgi:hypothetical protein
MTPESSMRLKIALSLVFVMIAVGAYVAVSRLSSPAEQDLMSEFKASQPLIPSSGNAAPSVSAAPVDVLLVGLKQRLENRPDDVDGWILLSKSYFHLNRLEPANEAYEKARSLGYSGDWQPLPRIDAFSQQGLSKDRFGSPINFHDSRINTAAAGSTGSGNTTANPPSANEATGLKLKDSAVFVFARSAKNPGPPLAVVRKRVDELPFEIALNDNHAMTAERTISSAESVIVGARISATGNARRQPGDYERLSGSIPANFNQTIELVIDARI